MNRQKYKTSKALKILKPQKRQKYNIFLVLKI